MARKPKSKSTLVNREKLAETGTEMEVTGMVAGMGGADQMHEGTEELDLAGDLASYGMTEAAAGASDITRAVDAAVVADRVQQISDIVGAAGVVDVAEGVEMLAKGENVEAWGAMVGLMSKADLERGLDLGRVAGELSTASKLVAMLQMPVLADFLEARGMHLQQVAVDVLIRAAGTRALGQAMAETGEQIQAMGAGEVAEGEMRMAVSDAAAERSKELSKASGKLAQRGFDEIETAEMATDDARMSAAAGATDIAEGSAMLGTGAAMEQMGEALEDRAEK